MRREWTDEQRDEWVQRRTTLREQQERNNPRSPSTDSLDRERHNVSSAVREIIENTVSWEVGFPKSPCSHSPGLTSTGNPQLQKHPLEQYPAPFAGRLYLPLRYMDDDDHAHIVRPLLPLRSQSSLNERSISRSGSRRTRT